MGQILGGVTTNPNAGRFEAAAMVGDDLDEDQQTTPDNDPDQLLWADTPQDDQADDSPVDATDPESSADEGSDTEDVRPVVAPPARVRSTDPTRGLPGAMASLVAHTRRNFSDVTVRALSPRMRQRGVALAVIVTTDGRVKVCQ